MKKQGYSWASSTPRTPSSVSAANASGSGSLQSSRVGGGGGGAAALFLWHKTGAGQGAGVQLGLQHTEHTIQCECSKVVVVVGVIQHA
jgi:hypothetical protein